MKNLENEIKAYALKNAIEYGKADTGRILPKLFQHGLEKDKIKDIMPEITNIVKEINKLKKEQIEKEYSKFKKFVKEREEKEKTLPDIEISDLKQIITRLAPEPSKYNHLGHALSFLLNYIYAKKYNGKCLLRFEDTNPEKVSQEYVDAMREDVLEYLDIKVDSIKYVSDDMPLLYDYAKKLIEIEKAYMCFCDREKMQELRHAGKECKCRNKTKKENLEEWEKFKKGEYQNGEAILRIKGNMKSDNQVMRDPVLFRYLETKHYRQGTKYKVWPMYDFYNPIEDSLMGVTLILRSNEFDLRVELQDYIKDLLELKKQKIVQYGRFNVIDFTTKGREIRELVESKELIGWDDPRLITLRALKRRGIKKEAIYELVNHLGLNKNQVNLTFDMIASINRKIIDSTSNRYSFVENPIKLKVKNAPKIKEIKIPIHPDKKETKEIKITDEIFISEKDYQENKNKEIRLLHLYNLKLSKVPEYTSEENKDIPKLNWVSENIKTKILMPDGKEIEGIAEKNVEKIKEGEIIQFERFGFCRLDKKEKNELKFWFTHK
jgi:glutamyl-tRNA synthetase